MGRERERLRIKGAAERMGRNEGERECIIVLYHNRVTSQALPPLDVKMSQRSTRLYLHYKPGRITYSAAARGAQNYAPPGVITAFGVGVRIIGFHPYNILHTSRHGALNASHDGPSCNSRGRYRVRARFRSKIINK